MAGYRDVVRTLPAFEIAGALSANDADTIPACKKPGRGSNLIGLAILAVSGELHRRFSRRISARK